MAGKGASPGERRGGRKKGIPNRATIERELAARAEAAQIEEGNKRKGRPTAKEFLNEAWVIYRSRAVYYQPRSDNPNSNEGKFMDYMKLAVDAASKVAPYLHPRLAQTTLQTLDGTDGIKQTHRIQIEYVDPPKKKEAGGA